MLRMKLPQRKSRQRAAEEEDEAARLGMCSRPLRDCPASTGGPGPGALRREAVYEWFVRTLGPAHRLEFACGLLDLCNPLELRFLGSCLEDLARKDCHYLRDYESRANGLAGPLLGDLGDPVTRSRLIVYLALLSSENRDVAGRLYRLLLPAAMEPELGGWEQEDELLLTMAALHPAFSFHQRVTLRERLQRLREAMARRGRPEEDVHEYLPSSDGSTGTHNGVGATAHNLQQEAVHIESINIKHVQRRRADKNSEYTFEVNWSDNSRTSVTKSYQELQEFILLLPKELANKNLDKTILEALQLGKKKEEPHYCDLEPIVKQIFSSPPQALLRNQKVYNFFQTIQAVTTNSNSHLQPCSKYCESQEDSSETSSQEEDFTHHTSIHKKSAGKCSVTNFIATSFPCDETHVPHIEQNGKDCAKNDCTSEHFLSIGHQRPLDKQSLPPKGRETSDRNAQKPNGLSVYKANGVNPAPNLRTLTGKDSGLEIGSGHETCGETSSESYSSPPSPSHSRRESFESEEEKDRDTDSNSEDSAKNISGFSTFKAVKASTAKLSKHLNNEESTTETVNNPKFPHFHLLPPLHCVMPSGSDKMEHGLPSAIPSDGKTLGMLVSPVSMSPVRELFHQNTPGLVAPSAGSVVGESEKSIDLLAPPLPVPSTFLPRNYPPSNPALHIPVHRMKLPSQGPTENCTVNGSAQASLGVGTASAGFISIHSPCGFTASPVTTPDPLTKPISQIASLSQVATRLDGTTGAKPISTKIKLHPLATNLPTAPATVPYALSSPALASGMVPSPNTNVLNASATVAGTQAVSGGIGQLQSIPPTVPTHSPGPAPSPSPALTHSTAQSDSTSFISAAVGNTSTNGALPPPQQVGQGACGSCGRRCGCGNSGIPFGNFYYPNPITGQMYARVPPLFIPSLCNNTYLSQAHQSNGTQYPVFFHQAPYTNGLMHEPVLGGQANYGMQQMANFGRMFPVYPASNVVGNANGSVTKKNGNISCYNCGVNGHYAQDCKQPPMDASQQGTFRLRYPPIPSNDSLDSAD